MPVVISGGVSTATVSPDHTNGAVTASWTNPSGSAASYNRLYHKRSTSTTGTWTLLRDSIPASIGVQQSVQIIDQIALSTPYDYAVSAVSAARGESALSTIGTAVSINPQQGGNYTAMLHIQGQGFTYRAALFLSGGPKIKEVLDAQASSMFNIQTPVLRYGISDYRELSIKVRLIDLSSDPLAATAFSNLQGVLGQMRRGAVAYYRDQAGVMMTVGLKSDAAQNFLAQIYLGMREPDLTFTQVPNQYSPSTTRGSAAGLYQQVNGNVVPLSAQELAV